MPALSEAPRVLITGVNGFIAGHLAERLLREGWRVRGTARRPDAAGWLAEQGVEVVPTDLMERDALARAAEGCSALLHAAAWTGGPELSEEDGYQVNVDGTANVLAAAQQAGVERFLYVSSVAVYGLNRAPLIDETAPTPKVGQGYPDSKIVAETLVRTYGLPFVIVRPASTYGPRGVAWTLGPVDNIKAGRLVLMGRDAGLVTPGYIDNVVDGLVLALTRRKAQGETFNLCDDRADARPRVPADRPRPRRSLRPPQHRPRSAPPHGQAARRPLVAAFPLQPVAVQRGEGQTRPRLPPEGEL